MFRPICICGLLLSASLVARADIHNLTASASGRAQLNATVSIQDPNQVLDEDHFDLNGSGSDDALAVIDVDGQFTGEATASGTLSTTPDSATFSWSGTAAVALDEDLNSGSISAQSNGHVDIDFDVVGSSAGYVISFSTASASFITVSLGGGGDGFDFCHNAFDPSACNPPNFPRSGTLPPGSYHIVADVRDTAGETTFFPTLSPTSYSAGFSLSLTLSSTPAFSWVNPAGGDFLDGNNWNPNVTPTSNSIAVVDLGGTFPINITGGAAEQLLVRDTTLDLFGGTLQLSSVSPSDPSLSIGGSQVTVFSGKIQCTNTVVGDGGGNPSATAVLDLQGSTSQTPALEATGTVIIGDAQTARLNVLDAEVDCQTLQLVGLLGANASAVFSGSRTLALVDRLDAGLVGPTDTRILDGAVVSCDETYLGGLLGVSTLTVSGVNTPTNQRSRLNAGVTTVGTSGGGALDVSNGATAECLRLALGSADPASVARVAIKGRSTPQAISSFLKVNGVAELFGTDVFVVVSDKGQAEFNGDVTIRSEGMQMISVIGVDASCRVAGTLRVAGPTGSAGSALVSVADGGDFSQALGSTGRLVVGEGADVPGPLGNTFTVTRHGSVIINHPITGFADPVRSRMGFHDIDIQGGQILVQGAGELVGEQSITVHGRLDVDSNLANSAATSANVTCGQLNITSNGVVRCCPHGEIIASLIVNEVGATLEGDTHVIGSVVTSGLLRPGCSPGTFDIEGDFTQTETGVLQMEIAGSQSGQFDVLKVSGKTALAGTLEVKFINGFVPSSGESLKMLEIGGAVTGQFAEVRVEGLLEGQAINVDPVSGQVSVGAIAAAALPPDVCGAGVCGAGVAPLWMAACALAVLRPVFRRRDGQ